MYVIKIGEKLVNCSSLNLTNNVIKEIRGKGDKNHISLWTVYGQVSIIRNSNHTNCIEISSVKSEINLCNQRIQIPESGISLICN